MASQTSIYTTPFNLRGRDPWLLKRGEQPKLIPTTADPNCISTVTLTVLGCKWRNIAVTSLASTLNILLHHFQLYIKEYCAD